MNSDKHTLLILGTRGIPASHGGFETFAERLALFLVDRGWHVVVYCQKEVARVETRFHSNYWQGIERIDVAVSSKGPRATLEFDWHCVRHASTRAGVCLVLGYNGAVFLPYIRFKGRKIVINMDGIEWRRAKWNFGVRAWFWINEWIAAWSSHRLIADSPVIADHLATRRARSATAMIPYGGDLVTSAPEASVYALGLEPRRYFISIARIEPENNILLMVQAFSRQRRGVKFAVLGNLDDSIPYHVAVREAAGEEVVFLGAIYDKAVVGALRFHARAYLHGHTVGGTNPSLVEALGAGNAVIAHDNAYNRWTAGPGAFFFKSIDECDRLFDRLLIDDVGVVRSQLAARARAAEAFRWTDILTAYENEFVALYGKPTEEPQAARQAGTATWR